MSTYEDAVKLISGAESNAERSFTIDSEELGKKFEIGIRSYGDAIRIMGMQESRVAPVQKPAQPAAAQQVPQVQKKAAAAKGGISMEKELKEAAAAVGSVVSHVGKVKVEKAAMKETKPVKAGVLVLPRLSLNDQINDLEKIKEGLDENLFDDKLLEIVKNEVDGMTKIAAKEKASPGARELVMTRNKMLKEISAIVG